MAKPVQAMQIAATTTDQTQNLGGAQQIYVSADAAIYIDFDQPIAASQSFKLPANTPLRFDLRGCSGKDTFKRSDRNSDVP